jgi:hypothetical protein
MKNEVRKIVEGARGDDLYRAKTAFRWFTNDMMDKPYGQLENTPRQIIADYEKHEKLIDDCLKWIDSK